MAGDLSTSGTSSSSREDDCESRADCYDIDTAEAAQHLLESSGCDTTGIISLQNCALALPAVTVIGDAFCGQSNLRSVILDNVFDGRPSDDIPKSMTLILFGLSKSKCSIEYLDISNNPLGTRGIHGLLSLLKSVRSATLASLKLENIQLDDVGAKELAKAMEFQRKRNQKNGTRGALISFKAGRNCMKDAGAVALSKVFRQMTTLEEIWLQENEISSHGIAQLAKSFSENTFLKSLNLSKNCLMCSGAMLLSHTLHYLPNLSVLDLSDCALGSFGGSSLAKVVSNLINLTFLNLSHNNLEVLTGMAIIEKLSCCPGVVLDLNENMFGPKGIRELQRMAEEKRINLQSLRNDLGERKDPQTVIESYRRLRDDGDDNHSLCFDNEFPKVKRPRLE